VIVLTSTDNLWEWGDRKMKAKVKTGFFAATAATMLVSLAIASTPASAKTIKACQKEWQADKVAMKAAGKTEKAFVAECRGTDASASTKPAAAPATKEDKGGGGRY
jgi:hypothetical protein